MKTAESQNMSIAVQQNAHKVNALNFFRSFLPHLKQTPSFNEGQEMLLKALEEI